MAERIEILHVDDDSEWRDWVEELLAAEGYVVSSFWSLSGARVAAQEQRFDVFICDGKIHRGPDGLRWANELAEEGFNVIVLATITLGLRVPSIKKRDWLRSGKGELVRLVKQMTERGP